MSKFIEVTAGTKVLINTDEIACIEPTKDDKDGSEVCVITSYTQQSIALRGANS